MSQPTDQELINAMHQLRIFTIRMDDGKKAIKPGLEMVAGDAGATLCKMRGLRTTWFGAGELQLRMQIDKLLDECGLMSTTAQN